MLFCGGGDCPSAAVGVKFSHLLTCRLGYHSPAQAEKEGLVDFVAREHGPPRTGLEFMFIFITAPPSMLPGLPHTSACGVCLLSPCTWSAARGPCTWSAHSALHGAPLPQLFLHGPRMVMLGVAEAGKCGFVFPSTAR